MLDVGEKLFEYESPSHDSLRCAIFCLVDQVFIVREYVYFVSKQDSSEMFEKFDDRENLLLCCRVFQLCF